MSADLTQLVRDYFRAYELSDPTLLENSLTEDFTFTSPFDDAIDRETYFKRCWPNHVVHSKFHFEALAQDGNRVVAVYRAEMETGNPVHPMARFRNAECFEFEGERLKSVTVFFGDPPAGLTRKEFSVQSGAG